MIEAAIPRGLAQGLRSGDLISRGVNTVLDAPRQTLASGRKGGEKVGRRKATVMEMPLRREPGSVEDYSVPEPDEQIIRRVGRRGVRVSFTGGLIPQTLWGRIAAAGGAIVLLGGAAASAMAARSFLLHDPHFVVENTSAIEIAGNSHLSRAQLLSVFGGDVERNIFRIPLDDRRAQLESLPWVEHATVMRLLPDRVRVAVQERTPVAFVRQGGQIALVDANGVLLDFGSGNGAADGRQKYSFPVVTGISQSDPLSTRAARMRIFTEFVAALDVTGEGISRKLSEVDLSDPEDVRATIPDNAAGTEVLVHFGQDRYLERYQRFEEHLPEWRKQYPRLASVDMRYEQQVVLDMQPGGPGAPADGSAPDKGDASGNTVAAKKATPALPHAVPRKAPASTGPASKTSAHTGPRPGSATRSPATRPAKKHVGAGQ